MAKDCFGNQDCKRDLAIVFCKEILPCYNVGSRTNIEGVFYALQTTYF